MIFKIFSPKNSAKKLAFLTQNKAKLCKILIISLGFEKNANYFRRKLSKIVENCDHNIDPRWDLNPDCLSLRRIRCHAAAGFFFYFVDGQIVASQIVDFQFATIKFSPYIHTY
jgi:hypothetical protein